MWQHKFGNTDLCWSLANAGVEQYLCWPWGWCRPSRLQAPLHRCIRQRSRCSGFSSVSFRTQPLTARRLLPSSPWRSRRRPAAPPWWWGSRVAGRISSQTEAERLTSIAFLSLFILNRCVGPRLCAVYRTYRAVRPVPCAVYRAGTDSTRDLAGILNQVEIKHTLYIFPRTI